MSSEGLLFSGFVSVCPSSRSLWCVCRVSRDVSVAVDFSLMFGRAVFSLRSGHIGESVCDIGKEEEGERMGERRGKKRAKIKIDSQEPSCRS